MPKSIKLKSEGFFDQVGPLSSDPTGVSIPAMFIYDDTLEGDVSNSTIYVTQPYVEKIARLLGKRVRLSIKVEEVDDQLQE